MSGNDYTRCGICGAVSLDEPLPCGHKTEVEQLREALWMLMDEIDRHNDGLPVSAETWDKCCEVMDAMGGEYA